MSIRRPVVPYKLSEKSYLLSDISRSNSPLPLPCIVEDGYYGASAWDTLSAGEVIFLNTLEKRPRAMATDGQIYYSIPFNYPLKFSVVSKGNEYSVHPTKTIAEILNDHKLPVTIKVDQKNTTLHLVSNLRAVLHLGNLVLTRTYDEKYFTGNSVINHELHNEMIMLPTFIKVRVRIIEGKTGLSAAQWADVLEKWKVAANRPSFGAIRPPIDIVMFSSIPQEAESKASTTITGGQQKASGDIYETLEPTTYVKLNLNLAQRKSNVYTPLSTAFTQPTTTTTAKSESKETTAPFSSSSASSSTSARPQSTMVAKTPDEKASTRQSTICYQPELQQKLSDRKPSAPHRPTPPPKLKKTTSVNQSTRRVPPTPTDTSSDEPPSSNELSPSVGQIPPLATTQDPSAASESLSSHPDPNSSDDVELNPDYQITPRKHSKIQSLKDIPGSVVELNSQEIADCLRLLKMAKYIDSFLANQINGALLLDFNAEILINDLQMAPMHARKLMSFAQKGWRPDAEPSETNL